MKKINLRLKSIVKVRLVVGLSLMLSMCGMIGWQASAQASDDTAATSARIPTPMTEPNVLLGKKGELSLFDLDKQTSDLLGMYGLLSPCTNSSQYGSATIDQSGTVT